MRKIFHRIAEKSSEFAGSPITFVLALASVIIWLAYGVSFNFSDTWQLVINTITNIVEFLILFLIQNTQNRNSKSVQIKLDELIRAHPKAKNSIIDLEKLSDGQLKELEAKYEELCHKKK